MTRLQAESQRLYLHRQAVESAPAVEAGSLIDAEGRVRALVLTLARPADWAALSPVWQAVQAELSLPAPAIAVSGVDAYQLWFSLAEAVTVAEAHAFLAALRERYLGHIALNRIGLLPALDAQGAPSAWPASMLPVREVLADQWSAFVAPDLAPIFAETPWLDIPPSPEGQAELLSRLQPAKSAEWQAACQQLRPVATAVSPPVSAPAKLATKAAHQDPRRFLLDVMNDEAIDLALRIEAAKALLAGQP